MQRKIVKIDESKCNGCGLCATACVEGAIRIVDGKARLVSDSYCDGLGACLGECPQGALTIEEREAPVFDEAAAMAHAKAQGQAPHAQPRAPVAHPHAPHGHVCPGTMAREMKRPAGAQPEPSSGSMPSELSHWPVQLALVGPTAPFLRGADLLLTADCVPFALADFHARFLRGRAVVIGCPKLDDSTFYVEKLTAILQQAGIRSLTVVHMEVPCCFGLSRIAQAALAASGQKIPLRDITVGISGVVHE